MAFIILALTSLAVMAQARPNEFSSTTQSPEASYLGLPASADAAIERTIDVKFSCAHRRLGYYADVSNDCKVFHICNPMELPDGQKAVMQYSFFCPTNTSFDQQSLTCAPHPNPVPCHLAEKYYHVNEQIGVVGGDLPEIRGQQAPAQRVVALAPAPVAVPTFHAVHTPAVVSTVQPVQHQVEVRPQQTVFHHQQQQQPQPTFQRPLPTFQQQPATVHFQTQPVVHHVPVAGQVHLMPTSDKVVRLG